MNLYVSSCCNHTKWVHVVSVSRPYTDSVATNWVKIGIYGDTVDCQKISGRNVKIHIIISLYLSLTHTIISQLFSLIHLLSIYLHISNIGERASLSYHHKRIIRAMKFNRAVKTLFVLMCCPTSANTINLYALSPAWKSISNRTATVLNTSHLGTH